QVRESLRRETRNLLVQNGGIRRQRVADPETIVSYEADDVAGVGFIHGFAFIAEQLMGTGQAHFVFRTRMANDHVAFEFAGTNADESDAIAVLRVHVRLNFENETGKVRIVRRDHARRRAFRRFASGGSTGRSGIERRRYSEPALVFT